MKGEQVLNSVSEAHSEGIKILTIMEALLSNKEKRDPYPNLITSIKPLTKEGKINFNYHWVKLFLTFRLQGKYSKYGKHGSGEEIQFEYPLIWGRYDTLPNGIKKEKLIVEDYKIEKYGARLDLVYNESRCVLENSDKCLQIINQSIYKCLPKTMVEIEGLELTCC